MNDFETNERYPAGSGYLGNPNIKRHGVQESWTPEKILEYKRCSEDPVYFIEKYIKVIHIDHGLVPFELYPFQRDMIQHIHDNQYSILKIGRQSGKSITTCAYLLWFAFFKPDKAVAILANKFATAKEMISRITLMLEHIPYFLQPGCISLNKASIEFSNRSKILASSSSSSGIRGLSIAFLYIDEAAFLPNAEEFYTSVIPTVSSGKDSRICISSTPKGLNLFSKLWTGAITGTNEYKPFDSKWWDVPGRDEEWKRKTIANTSERQFRQEHECEIIGSGNTLVDGNTLLSLKAQEPIHSLEGGTIRIYKQPIENHTYLMTVDVSKGRSQDYSTFNIIDITNAPFEQCAVYQDNKVSPLIFPAFIEKYATLYNTAFVIIEANDNGFMVANSLFQDYEYENQYNDYRGGRLSLGVEMTRKVKARGCNNIKDIIESGKLNIYDRETIVEICSFVEKGSSFEAEAGAHDDLMMNLVMFGWFSANKKEFESLVDIELRKELFDDEIKRIEDEMVPFGIVDQAWNDSAPNELINSIAEQKMNGELFGDQLFQPLKSSWN